MSLNHYLFKIIVLGDTGYGKTSLVKRVLKDKFDGEKEPTIGLDFATTYVELHNKKSVKFHIWDTAGQETFASIIKTYYKNIACAFIVMDLGEEDSFQQAEKWLNRYNSEKSEGSRAPPIIISNKLDIENRKYTEEEGRNFAKQYGCIYYEVSAKTGANCSRIMSIMAEHIYKHMNKNVFMEEPGIRKENYIPASLNISKKETDWFSCCVTQ